MDDDLFGKLIRGDLPASVIYENEHTFALLDINAVNPGHTIVVPKERHENIYTIPDDIWCEVMKTVKKVSIAVKKATNADGINIEMNNDPAAGQLVLERAHVHIIPRFKDDGLKHWPVKPYKNDAEKEAVAESIRAEL